MDHGGFRGPVSWDRSCPFTQVTGRGCLITNEISLLGLDRPSKKEWDEEGRPEERAKINCPLALIQVLSQPGQTQHLVFSVTLSCYLKFAAVCVAVHVFLNITYFSYWKYFLNGAHFSPQASARPFFSPGQFREPLGSGVAPWVSGPCEACPAPTRAPRPASAAASRLQHREPMSSLGRAQAARGWMRGQRGAGHTAPSQGAPSPPASCRGQACRARAPLSCPGSLLSSGPPEHSGASSSAFPAGLCQGL